jgi:hypothetical protein
MEEKPPHPSKNRVRASWLYYCQVKYRNGNSYTEFQELQSEALSGNKDNAKRKRAHPFKNRKGRAPSFVPAENL